MKNHHLRHSLSALALLAAGLSSGVALAQSAAPGADLPEVAGDWTFTSIAAAGAGSPRCELSRAEDGLTAIFATEAGQASLLLANPAWRLPNAVYDVSLEGDGMAPETRQANASAAGVSIDLGAAGEILPAIRDLGEIGIRTAQTVIPISLDGAAEGLRQLENCEAQVAAETGPAPLPEATTPPEEPQVAAAADCDDAKAHFDVAKEIGTREAYQAHLDAYPTCSFAPFAQMLMQGMATGAPTEPVTTPGSTVTVPPPAVPVTPAAPDAPEAADAGDSEADAIAQALVDRLNETLPDGPEDPVFDYDTATAIGEDVRIDGFRLTDEDNPGSATRLLFGETVLSSPAIASDGTLSIAGVELRNGETTQRMGSNTEWLPDMPPDSLHARVDLIRLDDLVLLPTGSQSPDALGNRVRIGGLEAEGLRFRESGQPVFALATLSSRFGEISGGVPTGMVLNLTTEPVPASSMKLAFEGSDAFFDGLGYPDYTFDFTLDFASDSAARTFTLNDLVLSVNEEAAIALNFELGGIDLVSLAATATDQAAFEQAVGMAVLAMTLNNAGFGFADEGMLNRVLETFATQNGIDPAVLKAVIPAQLKEAAVPLTGDPALGEKLQAAATQFLEQPGSIGIQIAPDAPVSFLELSLLAAGGDAQAGAIVKRLNPVIVVNELEPITLGALAGPTLSAEAQAAIAQCNELAADSDDPAKPADVAGVKSPADIDHALAIPACETAHAAVPSDPQMTFQLGRSYYAAGRFEDAVRLYREASEQGQSVAEFEIGRAYYNGQGVAKDLPAAIAVFEKLADDSPWAAGSLGNIYYWGEEGVAIDVPKAIGYWQKAADLGDADSKVSLAVEYINGNNVPADLPRAKTLLEEAAAADSAPAMAELGKMYFRGQGVTADYNQAYRYSQMAADRGDPVGLANAAYMLGLGYGTPKNPDEAARMMLSALALQDVDASSYLIESKADFFDRDFRRAVQRALRNDGVYTGSIDGDFGPGTLTALEAYKAKAGS